MRLFVGLAVLAELAVFILVAGWIGVGWTLLAAMATSALGFLLLARQGMRALTDLRDRARTRQPAGRELGDAGLVAVGGLLMVLPGFLGDLLGLLCLLPLTRGLVRGLIARSSWGGCRWRCGRRCAPGASASSRSTGIPAAAEHAGDPAGHRGGGRARRPGGAPPRAESRARGTAVTRSADAERPRWRTTGAVLG